MKLPKRDDETFIFAISDRPRRSSRPSLTLVALILFCFLSIALWHNTKHSFLIRFVWDECDSPNCDGIPDLEKFDCYPEGSVDKDKCQQRGCCFKSNGGREVEDFPPLNVPYCYYPSNYNGYTVSQTVQLDGRQITASLKRVTPSGYPDDVKNLKLVITFIDDGNLRIKITDADASRWEVPIPINKGLRKLEKPLYDVNLDSKTGQLSIKRKSSGTVIFKTDLSRLVYLNQFLQLSSYLPSSHFYGIGETYGSFHRNVNWTRFTLLNSDRSPTPNYPLYGSQPFYLSLEKDGNAHGVFLFNSNPMDVILQPTPAVTFRPIGGILDFFIMLGPSPANVVQQFTELVGRTFMPPYWSLGFHLCRFGYHTLNKTRETLERNIVAGIPIDVQWNDIDYMDQYKDFTYDKVNFAGLPEFVDDLHNRGMHYVIMTDPGISGSEKPGTYQPYEDAVKQDLLIKNPNGTIFEGKVWTDGVTVFPDFSHPNATSYWTKQFSDLYKDVKYDGVWIDMNELSNFWDGGEDGCMESSYEDPVYLPGGKLPLRRKTVCMTAKHYKTIHYNEHNLVGYREATATNQALKTIRKKRPFIISRASFSGQGAQSGHWSGDVFSNWEDMRYTIPSLLNFNLYGISMIGSDICGFNDNTTVPLCARWQALGAFYPFARNHNERVTIEQDPVAMGPVVVEATRKSLETRYVLLPYLYTLFYRSHVFGDTVIRPLMFEYPMDTNTYTIDEQFLWGPGLMIVPALYPNVTEVQAYFPKGVWYDIFGRPINSIGEKVNISLDITDIGVYMRGGYLLPGQMNAQTTTESRKQPFMLFGGLDENNEAKGELYWDDGDSIDIHETKQYTIIEFSANQNSLNTSVVHGGSTETMNLGEIKLIGLLKAPTEVSVNGQKCSKRGILNKDGGFNFFQKRTMDDFSALDVLCAYEFRFGYLAVVMKDVNFQSPVSVVWN
ncbi:hypothetical protein JTE90_002085 [Oedothorax gibbosus]|uniref:P-type domain-containing protein n=1 Tax=Oedothorax gibbosus TaxID=931172 RepID=A0AAV6UGZ8_9ARAC|nr:hypothetical protein JTE90_002085 [Oedothorax gibbosus]